MGTGNLYDGQENIIELNEAAFSDASISTDVWLVVFYLPTCGACIRFSSTWIEFANYVAQKQFGVKVGAVNCITERALCSTQSISGYPASVGIHLPEAPPGDNSTRSIAKGVTSLSTLTAWADARFTLTRGHAASQSAVQQKPAIGSDPKVEVKVSDAPTESVTEAAVTVVSAVPVTCEDRLTDAVSSFHFTLVNHVTVEGGDIELDRIRALIQFLKAVGTSVPGSKRRTSILSLANMVEDSESLRDAASFEKYIKDEWEIDGFAGPDQGWPAASRLSGRALDSPTNYSSGLWSLLHILTVTESPNALSPTATMEAIRAFTEYFFACSYCRAHFLQMYGNCDNGRCNIQPREHSRRNLALWIWRTHNAVTQHIQHTSNGVQIQDLHKHAWPRPTDCPECWQLVSDYGQVTWNEDKVLEHLQSTYWCTTWGRRSGIMSRETAESIYTNLRTLGQPLNPSAIWLLSVGALLCLFVGATHAKKRRRDRKAKKTDNHARDVEANGGPPSVSPLPSGLVTRTARNR